ncbi:MAG: ATP-binding protein [Pseudomonadota bacterium]
MASSQGNPRRFLSVFNSLSFRLIFYVGLILLLSISAWAYFNIRHYGERAIENIVAGTDRLGNTIRLGTHYAMMLNSRDDINQIIKNIARQKDIEHIRIYNKQGQIKFSNVSREVDRITNVKAEACDICHRSKPPLETVNLARRTRFFDSSTGHPLLGIMSPIYNEPGCYNAPCHVHPPGKKILGGLDVVVSLEDLEHEVTSYEKGIIAFAIFVFLGTCGIIGFFLVMLVNRPIKKMIESTERIGEGEYNYTVDIARDDEIGLLARAINQMGAEIGEKQKELTKQKEEYQKIFELAPCYITVQNRDLRLIRYNREFAEQFDPTPGDYCYKAYKGRSERCEVCPVLKTFEDGESHYSEEKGINKDGTRSYWIVRTASIKNSNGEIEAAMEFCLDITQMKRLEQEVKRSEEKYRSIFNTIPNAVFVLDRETLDILDCNDSVTAVYGFSKDSVLLTSFLELFEENERERYASEIKAAGALDKIKQIRKDGQVIYVNMRVSSSDYLGREVLLVSASDITTRLMAEQHLIQASKMATLGEMATGVAHELNQPLSVIKTASSFLKKKVKMHEPIKDDILKTMAEEIDSHVDRASRIINHMREFGRKSEVKKEKVQVNDALNNSIEIFSQQLKLREIEVVKDLEENLPPIMADSNRLEQVFINLLINARDAIDEKWKLSDCKDEAKKIVLRTSLKNGTVVIEVKDTGKGIPKSNLDKVFEPFFTTKKVGKGTGLGLSISYGIVQDYDGVIEVETNEQKGATFIIRFPVASEV